MFNSAKLFIALLAAILISPSVFSQSGYTDVIYLKNGSIVHGMIIEQVPNQSVKIQTKDRKVFVYKLDEIEKMTKEKKGENSKMRIPESKKDLNNNYYTGYSLSAETQFGPSVGSASGNTSFAMHLINGVYLKGIAYFGCGMGVDAISTNFGFTDGNGYSNTILMMDYYIHGKVFPLKGRISPLLIFDCGYSAPIDGNGYKGGLLINGGFGGHFNCTYRVAINVSLNYKFQKLGFNYFHCDAVNNISTKEWEEVDPQFLCLTIGFNFY